jgi:hypothetical protein
MNDHKNGCSNKISGIYSLNALNIKPSLGMNKRQLLAACIYIALHALSGCVNDVEPVKQTILTKTVIDQIVHENVLDKYEYDERGRVDRCDHYYWGKLGDVTQYIYSSDNLAGTIEYIVDSQGTRIQDATSQITYNSSNQPVSIKAVSGSGNDTNSYNFDYSEGRLFSEEFSVIRDGDFYGSDKSSCWYNSKGNIGEISTYTLPRIGTGHKKGTYYSYDDKINPFAGSLDYRIVYENKANPNNVTGIGYYDEKYETSSYENFSYTYNDENLPLTKTKIYVGGSYVVATYQYKKINYYE